MDHDDLDEPVRLVEHDPRWSAMFEREATLIDGAIGLWITGGIHHVGSTAIPGLAAKPTIDIAVGVADLAGSRPCIDILAGLGYLYWPYRADVMHWFCKPDPRNRTHHLHLMATGSARFMDEIAFRDYLRAHPESAARYERLKRRLAREHQRDREGYTRGKEALIDELTAAARAWQRPIDR